MSTPADFDVLDILLYAAAPYMGEKELEEFNGSSDGKLDSKVQDRIYKRLCREHKYYAKHEKYSPVMEAFKRVAIIILVVLSVGFTCVLSVDAARETIWKALIDWHENYFFFQYEAEDLHHDVPSEILEYKEPTVNERFERFEISKRFYSYIIEYESDNELIVYTQKLLEDFDVYVSNSNATVTETTISGHLAYKSVEVDGDETHYILIWNDGMYAYTLSGNIEYEELLKMAESIK